MTSLAERRHRAVVTAVDLVDAARHLARQAADLRARSTALRTAARRDTAPPWFTVRGFVDGRPAIARWSPGVIDADRDIARRAGAAIAARSRFVDGDGAPYAAASWDGPPLAVLLAVMRAFGEVTAVDFDSSLFEEERAAR